MRSIRVLAAVLWLGALGEMNAEETPYPSADFERIDVHVHVFTNSPAFLGLLNRLNLRALNICVVDKYDRGYEEAAVQHDRARELFQASNGRVAWCSTFDPQEWERSGFAQTAIGQLQKTFQEGAVAVKIYKSIGMEPRQRSSRWKIRTRATGNISRQPKLSATRIAIFKDWRCPGRTAKVVSGERAALDSRPAESAGRRN